MAEVSVSLQIFVVPGIELSISCKLSKNSTTELIPQGQSALTTNPFFFSLLIECIWVLSMCPPLQ